MNIGSVTKFLVEVPLIKRLPNSSLKKIAELVQIKHFDSGDYVTRRGKSGGGVYFVWEGEAEVCGLSEEEIRAEFILKRCDYFGNADCLVLPSDHCALLRPKSIWNPDEKQATSSPVESLLHLDPIAVNLFQGITLPDAPKFQKVFGGQFIGHALAAASKTVDCLKSILHFQAYFLLVGDYDVPIIYQVHRLHDGKSFSSRRVDAMQKGNVVFTLLASFQLLSLEELREERIVDPRFPRTYRNKVAMTEFVPWPIDIRFCDPNTSSNQTKSPSKLRYWFRAKGKLSDEQALHRCVVSYASDLLFIKVIAYPHRNRGLNIIVVSLNHTMWFHRPVKADDWLLYVIESPSAHSGRGLIAGQMYNRNGELVVSLVQEGLLREARKPGLAIRAKY